MPEINFWKKVERLPRNASLDVLTYLDQRASSVEPDVRLPDQHLQAYLDEFCSYLTSLEILDGVTRYVILEHDTSNKRSDDVPPWQAEFERVLFVLSGTMLGFLGSQIAAKRFVSHHLAGYVSLLTRSAGASAARNAERRVSDFSTFLSNKVKLFAIDLDKMKAQFDEGLFALK